MGFWVERRRRESARQVLGHVFTETARDLAHALPFSTAPVLYDFAINEQGSVADWCDDDAPTREAAPPAIPARTDTS